MMGIDTLIRAARSIGAPDDNLSARSIDGRSERLDLVFAVTDGWQHGPDVRVSRIDLPDRAGGMGPRVEDPPRPRLSRSHETRAVRHPAVRNRRSIIYDQYPPSPDGPRIVEVDR